MVSHSLRTQFRPGMIAIDIDATLLGAEGKVSARNVAAMQAAIDAGIEVVIATGRRHSYAMRVLRGLDLADETVLVSSNGTVTRTLGARLIERNYLARETATWLCEHLDDFRNAMVITFDLVQPDGEDARGALVVEELEDLHSSIGKWMEANAAYIQRVVPIEDALREGNIAPIQMMLCGSIARMRLAEERLAKYPGVFVVGTTPSHLLESAEVALNRTEYPDRDLSLLDILPAGCSKGAALTRLARERVIPLAGIMAIGDNWNDLSMLEIAGRSVLMENAPEDLKEIARAKGWTIGGHHLQDAVAAAVEAVLSLPPQPLPVQPTVEQEEPALSGSLSA